MSSGDVVAILQRTLGVMLVIGGPLIISSLAVGLVVSVIQAATQVNEQTMTFVPKVMVISGILLVFGPAMLETLLDFTRYIMTTMATVAT